MKRIDAPFHVNNRFVDGNAQTGTRGTRVDSTFLNAVQEEMAHVIERAGFALDPNDSTQLAAAISRTTGRYYPTLAEARADIGTKLEAGNVVSLGGYAEPGDGGATVAAVHAAPQSYFPGGGEIAPVTDDVTLAMFGGSAEGVGVGYDDGIGRVDGGDNPVTDNRPAAEAALTFLRKVHGGGRLRIPATAASWGASGPFLIPSNVTVEGPGTFENWISQSLELNFWWQMGASLGNLYAFGNGEGLHDAFPARTCPAHPAGTTTLGPLDVSGIGIGDVLAIESKARRTRTVDGVTSDTLYARYCDFAIVLAVGADSLAIDRPLQQALTGGGDIRLCTTDEDDARTTVFNSLTVPLAGRRLYLARNAHSHGVFYRLMNGLIGDERGIGLHWACFESSVIGNRFEFGQGAANGNPFGYSRFENNTCRSQRVAVESAYYTVGSTCIGNRIDVVEGALSVTGLALPVRWGGEDWGLGNVVRDNRARWLRPEVSENTGAMEIAGEEALVEANLVEAGVMNTAISFQSASQIGRGNAVRGATQYAIRAAAGSTLQEGNRIAPGNRTASFYAGTGTGLFTKNFLGGGAIAVEDYNAFFAGTLQVDGNFEGQMLNDYTLNDDRTQIAAGVTGTIHGVGFAETEVNRPCEIAIDVLVDIEAGQGNGIKNFPLRINGTTVATVKYPDGTTGVSRLSARVTELGRQDKVYTLQLTGAVNEYKQGTFTSANTPSGNSVTLLGAATGTGNIAYERLEVRTVTPDIIPV